MISGRNRPNQHSQVFCHIPPQCCQEFSGQHAAVASLLMADLAWDRTHWRLPCAWLLLVWHGLREDVSTSPVSPPSLTPYRDSPLVQGSSLLKGIAVISPRVAGQSIANQHCSFTRICIAEPIHYLILSSKASSSVKDSDVGRCACKLLVYMGTIFSIKYFNTSLQLQVHVIAVGPLK